MGYQLIDKYGNKYSELDYIKRLLQFKNLTFVDLKDLFGVSATSVTNWKNGKIDFSYDKKIYLSRLFGVTLDEYYNREVPYEILNQMFYNLESLLNEKEYKKLTKTDLDLLFELEVKYKLYIARVLKDEKTSDVLDCDVFDYICSNFKVSCSYLLKGMSTWEKNSNYLTNNRLEEIRDELIKSWGNDNIEAMFKSESIDLIEIMYKSENIKYISNFIFEDSLKDENEKYLKEFEYLEKYVKIKENHKDFDIDSTVLKTILAEGVTFVTNGKKDYEKTYKYLMKFIRKQIYDDYIEEK